MAKQKRLNRVADKLRSLDWESNAMTKEIVSQRDRGRWVDRETDIHEYSYVSVYDDEVELTD
jgi:hypothetical protein